MFGLIKVKDRTIELLEKYLDGGYRISPMAPNKSTIQDIKLVQERLGIKFPKEYIAHLLGEKNKSLGNRGIYIEVKEELWTRPKPFDVGPFWTFLYGIHTYTASKESEDWMRLEFVGKEFFNSTGIKAVPILKIIGDADLYCVDENGQIVIYSHEENKIESLKMTFWEVLEFELKELRKRKEQKIEENKNETGR